MSARLNNWCKDIQESIGDEQFDINKEFSWGGDTFVLSAWNYSKLGISVSKDGKRIEGETLDAFIDRFQSEILTFIRQEIKGSLF